MRNNILIVQFIVLVVLASNFATATKILPSNYGTFEYANRTIYYAEKSILTAEEKISYIEEKGLENIASPENYEVAKKGFETVVSRISEKKESLETAKEYFNKGDYFNANEYAVSANAEVSALNTILEDRVTPYGIREQTVEEEPAVTDDKEPIEEEIIPPTEVEAPVRIKEEVVEAEEEPIELITEQITCFFVNSEKEQQCYISGSFTLEDEGTRFCKGFGNCIVKVSGYEGEKITWKSSCGGYDYSIVDGVDNNVDFDCGGGEVEVEVLRDKGFRYAYWNCYDGYEEKQGSETVCKPSDVWQSYAKKACENRCYEDNSKCGVNSFSVSSECYFDEIKESEEEVSPIVETTEEAVEIVDELIDFEEEVLICKDSCPLNNKCYPFGYRKGGKYCFDDGMFVDYKNSKETCDNNFECKSNVCIDGECISSGLLRQILDWLRGLFGG